MVREIRIFLAGLALCPGLALGQIRSGSIVGRIADPSSAPVPNAQIIVIAQDTNVQTQTLTNSVGEYSVPYLAAGQYTVRASAVGFAPAVVKDLNVGAAEIVRADIKLELGNVTTAVQVTGAAAELQTESATQQSAVASDVIDHVPNINHNAFQYAVMQAGVTSRAAFNDTQSTSSFGIGTSARRQFSAISIGGGLPFNNDIQLDGVSIQGATWNEATVLPNPDSIQEVRALVNNYSAEYGRGQGVVTVIGKSGTNQYHGSAFERLRNEALNSNTFANNARGLRRDPFKVNTYGGTLGGPVIRNAAFFFVSYQGLKTTQGVNNFSTVPSAAERNGDFSQTVINVNGQPRPLQLFDPFSAVLTGPNVYQRALVPNAMIPNPDPFAMKVFSYYPLPNRQADDVYETNNFLFQGNKSINRNSGSARLDYHRGKHSWYGTGGISQGSVSQPAGFGPASFPFSNVGALDITDYNPYAAVGDTIVLSNSLVLDVRYGVARINTTAFSGHLDHPFDYSQFGIPAELQAINPFPTGPPNMSAGGRYTNLSTGAPGGPNQDQHGTNHHFVGSVTKNVNRWTLKAGAEYRAYLSNLFSAKSTVSLGSTLPTVGDGTNVGGIGTLAAFTAQLVTAVSAPIGSPTADLAGFGPAAFLYGVGTAGVAPGSGLTHQTLAQKYGAIYSQNDWRATSKLTVNLGLRWDVQPGPTDRYNKFCAFDPAGKNPYYGSGAYVCPGVNGNSRNLWQASWRDFGPRLGLAYKLGDSLVVRAGYGLNYLPTNTGYRDTPFAWGMDQFAPYTSSNPLGPNPAAVPIGPFYSLAVNRIIPAAEGNLNVPYVYGGTTTERFFAKDYPTQNSQQWNLFIQKSFGPSWQVSVGYAGSKGSHLMISRVPLSNSAQYVPDSILSAWRLGYIASNGRTDPGAQLVPNPVQPAGGPLIPFTGVQSQATVTALQASQPYPLFTGLQSQRTLGWSTYNSLAFQVNRRLSQGLLVNAHYTWSKALDYGNNENLTGDYNDTGGGTQGKSYNLRDFSQNYSPSYSDIPHRLVVSLVYELPFGKGQRFALGNRVGRAVAGGWVVSTVGTLQSGSPLAISGASTGSLNTLPDRVSGQPVEVPKDLQHWYNGKTTVTLPNGSKITPCNMCFLKFNPAAFSGRTLTAPNGSIIADNYWFGAAAPTYTDIRGNGLQNWNITIDRTFRIRESASVQFSAQMTNALNHAEFRPSYTMALGAQNIQAVNPTNLPVGQGTSSNFGTMGTTTFDPRQVELVLKVRF